MRGPLLSLLCGLLCPLLALDAQAASLQQQRLYYDEANRAQSKGDAGPYQRYASALQDYPLEPYLAYDELTHRLKWASNDEIETFIADHGDLPQIGWMKLRWLRWLAERGEWQTFINYYDPKLNFTELDCLYGQYLFKHGMLKEGQAQAEKLYLVGKSQPEACDVLFGLWREHGGVNEQQRWQRAKLAAEARNYGLASFLIKGLPTLGKQGEMLLQAAQNPNLLSQPSRFVPADRAMADAVGLGLRRLARQDTEKALGLIDGYARQMPGDLASTSRWRYWQARSLQLAQPNSRESLGLYQPVAGERDFYGFLSADRINAPYQLNHKPMAIDPRVMQKVRNTAGIRRALEFHARGQIGDGRREWYHVARLFSREELVAQARLGYEMEWYFPAIRSISMAQYWDDLDVRFPMAHQGTLTREARSRGLHSSWVFAITRQESGFMADARSHVGAMGLMQLMPATAKETARRFGIPLRSPQQALNPDVNIQLGAAYLSQVYGQFGGNRILASAAYNAGPGRVRQWLSGNERMPFDIWIETIPFDETRQYVQNVLSYSVIYGEKLGAPQKLVEWHERELGPQ